MDPLEGGPRRQARRDCPDRVPNRDVAGHTYDAPIIIDSTTDASESTDGDIVPDFVQTLLTQAGQASDTRLGEATANFQLDRLNDRELWWMCQRFFKLQGTEGQMPSHQIDIDGLRVPLKPHQAFAAFYMLHSEKRRHGGFLADEMGLGKTITVFAVCALSRWLTLAHDEVTQYRKDRTGSHPRHLPEGNLSSNPAHCPSAHLFPICCPCVGMGPSITMKPLAWPTLILVPAQLLRNWGNEWNKAVDTKHPRLRMTLLVGHRDSRSLQQPDVQQWEACAQNQPDCPSLRFARSGELARAFAWQALLGKGSRQLRQMDQQVIQEWNSTKDRRVSGECPQLWKGNGGKDRLVVLTTPQSYGRHVANALECEATVEDASGEKATRSVCGALWGRAFRDECHQEKNEAKTCEILKGLRGGTRLWFLSGTPFEISPADLAQYVDCLWGQAWKRTPELADCSREDFEELGRQFNSARDRQRTAVVVAEFRRRLQALGFIRRTVDSQWFGEKLLTLPTAKREDIICALDRVTRCALRSARTKLEREYAQTQTRAVGKSVNILHRLRLFTTFPALAQVSQQEHLPLTLTDIKRQPWPRNNGEFRSSPFQQHLQAILEGSAKFKQLCSLVRSLELDCNGQRAKILVMSEIPVAAIITYLGLTAEFPDQHPALLLSGQLQRNQRYVDAFNEMNTGVERSVEAACGQLEWETSPGILVSTTRILGLGFTCVRAFHAVLLEPSLLKSTEDQAFGRIHRIGQMNDYVYQVRLLTKDSDVEKQIIQRQATRQELQCDGRA